MTTERDSPYIWVTSITGVLAGDFHCEWSAWFRAHFKIDKRPTDFNLAVWTAQHGEMVLSRAAALKSDGYEVYVEEQNKFNIKGKAATLGGKPDLVAVRDTDAIVIDCKTGQQRNSDYFQVLTYMLFLPLTHSACKEKTLAGELQYRNHSQRIEPRQLTDELRAMILSKIKRVGGSAPLPKIPSPGDCRFCDIGLKDCPERVHSESHHEVPEHDLF
jgi:CRISPR/Cas system-associated exonuclease Cas4 (RecB family)